MIIRLLCVVGSAFFASAVFAQNYAMPTLDQALEISETTGRPIFAMAGQST